MIPWVLYGMPDLFIDWIETKPGMAKTQILVKNTHLSRFLEIFEFFGKFFILLKF